MNDAPRRFGAPGRMSVFTGIATAALQAGSLIVFALLSHILAPTDLGVYRQALIIQSIAIVISSLAAPTAMLYLLGRSDAKDEHSIYGATLLIFVFASAASALGSGLLSLGAGWYLGISRLAACATYTALSAAALTYTIFVGPILLSRGAARWYVLVAAAQSAVTILGVWYWARLHPQAEAALLASAVAGACGWTVTAVALLRLARESSRKAVVEDLRRSIVYGLPIALSSGLYTVAYQIDHFVAVRLLSSASYALYAAGAWELPIGALVQRAQADVLLPILSGHHASGRNDVFWNEWRRLLVPWLTFGVLLFWALFPTARDVTQVVLGDRFSASANVLRVYALLLPLRMASFTLPQRAIGVRRIDVFACLGFAATNLVVGVILTPRLGVLGPAIGFVAGYCVWALTNSIETARVLDAPVSAMLPWRTIATIVLVIGISALPAWALSRRLFTTPGIQRLVAYGASYLGGVAITIVVWRRLRIGRWGSQASARHA